MVEIVDGHQEEQERIKRDNALEELARKSFVGAVRKREFPFGRLVVSKSIIPKVEVYYWGEIEVHDPSYLKSATEFAKEAEKLFDYPIRLKTTYQH